ncbi:MAG TPA: tail fiber protein [Gemmatimonadaceae bacterium]|nr:tail fiber protein [Gemmatimonadaceae bacterium]
MDPYLGEIRLFAGTFAPLGWNFCDGTLVAISTNDALYALIGTAFGGDGQTTFALPDLRGRVPIHQGRGQGGLSPYVIGQTGGTEQVTLTAQNIPAHTHTLAASKDTGTTPDPTGILIAKAPDDCKIFIERGANTAYNQQHISPSNGGGQPHDNRQPLVAINYIIAMAGIFPSQS